MNKKWLLCVSLGMICGLSTAPDQVQAQRRSDAQQPSLPPDWINRISPEPSPQKRLELLNVSIEEYDLERHRFPARLLAPLLKDQHPRVRELALRLLNPSDADSLAFVVSALEDADEGVLLQAIDFLVQIKGNDSAPYLFRFLEQGPPQAEASAVYMLGRYKHPEGLGKLVKGMTRYGAEVVTPALGKTVSDGSGRFGAYVWALQKYPLKELKPLLSPALAAPEAGVRLMAFKILYSLQDPEVERPLLAWMRSAPEQLKPTIMERVLIRNSEGYGVPLPTQNPEILAEILTWALGKPAEPLQSIAQRYVSFSVLPGQIANAQLLEPYFQNPETREQLLTMLPQGFAGRHPHFIPYILPGLHSSNKYVVLKSLSSFMGAESRELDETLSKLLKANQDPEILRTIFWLLTESPQNLALLKKFAQHPDAKVRAAALEKISSYRAQDAKPDREALLKQFREDPDHHVRLNAFKGLCQFKDDKFLAPLLLQVVTRDQERASDYIRALGICSPHKPELLYPFLKLGAQAQLNVVSVLIDWRSSEAVAQVAPLLNSGNPQLQSEILNLVRLTTPEAAGVKQYIAPLLRSSDPNTQEMALSAWDSLKGLEYTERRAAIPLETLNASKGAARVKALSILTMDHGVATDLRLFTRQVLQETKYPYDFARLLESLYYADDPQTLLPLLDHADQRVRESVVQWFRHHGNPELMPELQRVMPTYSPPGLAAALETMGLIASREQAPLIQKYTQHSDAQVRLSAMLALGLLRQSEATALAEKAMHEVAPEAQFMAIRALQALRTPEAVPGLVTALASPLEESRRAAVMALRKINARSALPEIMRLFSQQSLEDLRVGCFGFPQREGAVSFLSHLVNAESLPDFMTHIQPEDLFYKSYLEHGTNHSFHLVTVADLLAELTLPHQLLPYLNDTRPLVRLAMAETLSRYPDPQWAPSLQARLKREEHPLVKLFLRLSLGRLGDQSVVQELLEDYQKPAFKQQQGMIAETLFQLKASQFFAALQQQALLHPEDASAWAHLSRYTDEQTLDWLKQMTAAQDVRIRKNAITALQKSQSRMNPSAPEQNVRRAAPTLDKNRELKLRPYLAKLERIKGQPRAMLQLAHDFLNASSDEGMHATLRNDLQLRDPKLIPVWVPLLVESKERYNQVGSHRDLAMRALKTVKLSPEDPLLLDLIQHLPPKDRFVLQLFQAQLWYEQGQSSRATEQLKSLLKDAQLSHYPAYQVRVLQGLSDFSPASERLMFLNQMRDVMDKAFTERDFQHFEDLPEMLSALRFGDAYLAVHEPLQAQKAYQQALGELYTHYSQRNLLITPFAALIHAGLAEAAMQQGQKERAQAHLILALNFWSRNSPWGVRRSEYFTDYLPVRHSPQWAYEKLIQSLSSPEDAIRLNYFQKRFSPLSSRADIQ